MKKRIAIIGGGNLGKSIAEGLMVSEFVQASDIIITRRNITSLLPFKEKGIEITSDNVYAVQNSDVIILAVKPFQVSTVLEGFSHEIKSGKLLISVVTGVLISDIEQFTGNHQPIFRAMPNTAIAIRESITCICSNQPGLDHTDYVQSLFNTLGKTVTTQENLMEAATILGACGTAYAMRYIRANIQGGIEIGFDAQTASLIAAQTVKGAAELLLQHKSHPEEEIDKVTTPKGCTIAGLNEMEHRGFSSSLIRGIVASYKKIAKD